MRAAFRNPDMSQCPKHLEAYARNPHLTPGREYDVQAISVYEGVVTFLVIDDLDYPGWRPAWLFTVAERSLPNDWICNALSDWPEFLVGPSFIAESQDAYARMVELEPTQVDRLRQRNVRPKPSQSSPPPARDERNRSTGTDPNSAEGCALRGDCQFLAEEISP